MGWRETANPAQLSPSSYWDMRLGERARSPWGLIERTADGFKCVDPDDDNPDRILVDHYKLRRPEITDRTIADLKPGETAYTLPWAHSMAFPVEATPTGKKVMPVRRDGDGFVFMEPDWSVYDPDTAGLIAKYLSKSNSAHVRDWAAEGERRAQQPIMVTVDGRLNAETQEALRRACARGLVTPAMARDAFASMVEADTPKPAPRPRTTSPDRDRFERKYGARPLPANETRPRRKWLWRSLYVVAALVTLAASVATLWQIYGG